MLEREKRIGGGSQDPVWKFVHVPYCEEDGLDFATQLPPGLGDGGVHEQVGGDALAGHTFVTRQHPDDHIRNAVLGL